MEQISLSRSRLFSCAHKKINLHDRPNFNDNRHPLSRETLKQNTVLNGFAESRVTIIRYFHFQNIFLKLVLNNINEEEVERQNDQQGRLGFEPSSSKSSQKPAVESRGCQRRTKSSGSLRLPNPPRNKDPHPQMHEP